jgi:hypothetical protein
MASATEQVVFEIQVKLDQAERALNELRTGSERAAGAGAKHVSMLDQMDKASRHAAQASGLLGGALGGAAGEAARATGDIIDLIDVVKSGTAGVGLLSVAVGAVAVGAMKKAEDEVARAQAVFNRWFDDLKRGNNTELAGVIKGTRDLADELANLGKSTQQVTRDRLEMARGELAVKEVQGQAAQAALQQQKQALEAMLVDTSLQGSAAGMAKQSVARQQLRLIDQGLAMAREDLALTKAKIPELDKQLAAARELLRIDNERRGKGSGSGGGAGGARAIDVADVVTGDSDRTGSDSVEAQLALVEQANAAREALIIAGEESRVAAVKKANEQIDNLRMQDLVAQERALSQVRDLYKSTYEDAATGAFTSAVGAANDYFIMLAKGEEHAAEKATAAFLSGVGNQIVGLGTKAVIEGALMNLALPGTGIPLMAGGAAAIGVGIGMGAGGAALGASIPSGSSSGGSLDRGVNSGGAGGSSGGGGNGGPHVEVHNYGVYSPTPEGTSRATTDALRRAQRRGLR